MTVKQKILRMVQEMEGAVTYDRVIRKLTVMRDIEISLKQAERGEVIDHDELFDKLLGHDEKASNRVVPTSKRAAGNHPALHRPKGAKKGA